MKRILTISTLLLLSFAGLGQTVVTKTGSCLLSETGTDYEKAVQVALDRAKVFAVSEVCGEDVSVFSLSRTNDSGTSFMTKYNVNTYGVVRVLDKVVERRAKAVYVTMTGEVYRVIVPRAINSISGLNDVYRLDDDLRFDVEFSKRSFLKIFWFDEENGNGGILYNGCVCFNNNNKPVSFPSESYENYKKVICPNLRTPQDCAIELAKNGTLKPSVSDGREVKYVTLLFVTTPQNVEFDDKQEVTESSFMDWWCNLEYGERELPEKRTITIKMM